VKEQKSGRVVLEFKESRIRVHCPGVDKNRRESLVLELTLLSRRDQDIEDDEIVKKIMKRTLS
jgi:hypothetical protein